MIGTIGFSIGALTIGLFAATSYKAYRFADRQKLQLFSTAFGLFAVAMVMWAIAAANDDVTATIRMLFASDVLLLAGTIAMALLLVGTENIFLNVGLGAIGAILLSLRAFSYQPTGYVHDGLLHFNLAGGVRMVVLLSFVLIWLPAMVHMSFSITREPTLSGLRNALTSSFLTLVITSALFLSARRSWVIITLFVFIAVLFLIMSILNMVMMRLYERTTSTKGKVNQHAPAR